MSHVIRIIGSSTGERTRDDGRYLLSYEPDVGKHGRFATTSTISSALTFEDTGAALECWRQVNKRYPTRTDGKPNRPLTAFTVEIVTVES